MYSRDPGNLAEFTATKINIASENYNLTMGVTVESSLLSTFYWCALILPVPKEHNYIEMNDITKSGDRAPENKVFYIVPTTKVYPRSRLM